MSLKEFLLSLNIACQNNWDIPYHLHFKICFNQLSFTQLSLVLSIQDKVVWILVKLVPFINE
jgi:hypothetical protein